MEQRRDNQNLWIWIGGIPALFFLFAGNPEKTGLFFIFAMIPLIAAIFLAFVFLKAILRLASNASLNVIEHLAASLRPDATAWKKSQGALPARHSYNAEPHSM